MKTLAETASVVLREKALTLKGMRFSPPIIVTPKERERPT
jgi:hypothetical protein